KASEPIVESGSEPISNDEQRRLLEQLLDEDERRHSSTDPVEADFENENEGVSENIDNGNVAEPGGSDEGSAPERSVTEEQDSGSDSSSQPIDNQDSGSDAGADSASDDNSTGTGPIIDEEEAPL